MIPSTRMPTRRPLLRSLLTAVGSGVVAACAGAPPTPPLTFAEAGLSPPPAAWRKDVPGEGLDALTYRLLSAIERETGQRPALESDDELFVATHRETRRRARGWNEERAALVAEVMRATDAGEATVGSLRRARAALRWDRLAALRMPAVDRALVEKALARADALIPREPVTQAAGLEWPVDPVRITSRFGVRIDPVSRVGARMHTGIDLAALEGQAVWAAGAGEVVFAGRRGGYGLHVDVRHEGGLVTRYAHLSESEVRVRDRVEAGALIGRAGQSGRVTGPHLHFEVWRDELPVDPFEELPDRASAPLLSRHR